MNSGSPADGIVVNYDDMIPIPVITNNPFNNTLVFNNALETTFRIASVGSDTLEFNSPALFETKYAGRVQRKLVITFPMQLPYEPMSLNIPAINSIGTVQATDLMTAKKQCDEIIFRHIWDACLW